MSLDPVTVAFELVNFLLLVLILRRFLFRPVRRIIERRRQEIEQRGLELMEKQREAAGIKEEYERNIENLQRDRERLHTEALARAKQEADAVVDAARDEMRKRRQALENELVRTRERLLTEIEGEIVELATESAAKILREVASLDLTEAYAVLAASKLAHERGQRLEEELVQVWIPVDVEYESIRTKIVEHLGPCRLEVRTDPALIAGVRLLAGDQEVEASASVTLQAWLESVKAELSDESVKVAGWHASEAL